MGCPGDFDPRTAGWVFDDVRGWHEPDREIVALRADCDALQARLAAAEAAVAVRDALLREVCAAVETRKGSTCDVPWSLVARIDTTLRGDATSAKEAPRG